MQENKPTMWDYFADKKVSVLIDHLKPHSELKESYVGTLIGEVDNFIVLSFHTGRLSTIWIRKDMILSIWEYN